MTRLLAPLTALLLSAAGAAAQEPPAPEPVRLEYAFDRLAGKTATYVLESRQVVGQEVEGRQKVQDEDDPTERIERGAGEAVTVVRETQEHRFLRANEGGGRVEVTTRRIEARLEQQGELSEYDSAEGGPPPPQLRPLAEKVGRTVTLEVARDGRVRRVKGAKGAQERAYEATYLRLPAEPLPVGESWDRLERLPMEPLGTLVYHFHYELAEATPARRIVSARIRASVEEAPTAMAVGVEITEQAGGGRLVLDGDGLVVESTMETLLELTIKSPAGVQVQRLRNESSQRLTDLR